MGRRWAKQTVYKATRDIHKLEEFQKSATKATLPGSPHERMDVPIWTSADAAE